MKVHELINLLNLFDQNSQVHVKVIGKWDFIDKAIEIEDTETRNFLPTIEFYGVDIRCDASENNKVIIYSELKEINKNENQH